MDKAVERRLVLLPFLAKFVEEPILPHEKLLDKDKGDVLLQNIDIFFIWLVKGCIKYYQSGLGTMPDEMKKAKQEYYLENDDLGEFLTNCCDTSDPHALSPCSDIYESYKEFVGNNDYSQKVFSVKMKEKGYHSQVVRKQKITLRCYKNLKIKDGD